MSARTPAPLARRACVARRSLRCFAVVSASAPPPAPPRRIVVVGAGFAGVATAYHVLLLAASRREAVAVRVVDAGGLGGGASGVAAGLLHPYAPGGKPGRLLWRGAEGCAATQRLLAAAEAALGRPVAARGGTLHAGPPGPAEARAPLSPAQATARLPGLVPPGGEAQPLLLHAGGCVVRPRDYLEGLWAAAAAAAAAGEPGSSVTLERRRAPSLAALCADAGAGGAVVVAAGAAAQALPELQQLPLRLSAGAVIHFSAAEACAAAANAGGGGDEACALPPGAPALAGAVYLAPDGAGGVALGATKERPWSTAEASFGAGELQGARADAALEQLLPAGAALLPALERSAWFASRRVAWGVRALPPRATLGRLPLLRALPRPPGAPAADCWLLAGLGSRGLVWHALLAEALAAAVLGRDPSLLPADTAQ